MAIYVLCIIYINLSLVKTIDDICHKRSIFYLCEGLYQKELLTDEDSHPKGQQCLRHD